MDAVSEAVCEWSPTGESGSIQSRLWRGERENVVQAVQWMPSEVEDFDWREEGSESITPPPHLTESFVIGL